MWFNHALIYHYQLAEPIDPLHALCDEQLKPCPPHARFIYGWLPPLSDALIHEVAGVTLFCQGKEERVLPRNVIQRAVKERVLQLETQRGYPVKRAERGQLAEDIEFELLPKAFCLQKRLLALLDANSQRLIINTSSTNQGSQLLSLLRKSLPGVRIEPLAVPHDLAIRFAMWIKNPASLPPNFELASDCLLFSLHDEKKRFNCKGCELSADEIQSLLSQECGVAEISLIWHERIQFTLTQQLVLKRIKCLDLLIEDFQETERLDEAQQTDATITLFSGELRLLLNELLSHCQATAAVELCEI